MNNNKIIVVKDVVKTYGTNVKTDVLKNVSFELEEGSFNWIVGASGSGKTTLLNIISGLDSLTSGEVYVDGKLISSLSEKESAKFRAFHLGFIFQFHYLLPEFSALENVLMPLRIQKKKITKEVEQKAIDLLTSIGLGGVYKHYPKEMSGGEQQRTAIARAIIGNPRLVIADEPTGNLDSNSAEQVYKIIRQLHEEHKITFIIVTHDKIIPQKNDRIFTLKDGEVIKDEIF